MFQAWPVKMAKIATASAPITFPGNKPSNQAVVKVKNPSNGTDSRKLTNGKMTLLAVLYFTAKIPKQRKTGRTKPYHNHSKHGSNWKVKRFDGDKKSSVLLGVARNSSEEGCGEGDSFLAKRRRW